MDSPTPLGSTQKLIKLSWAVWLRPPAKQTRRNAHPRLVVICGWLHAPIRHLAKYAEGYSQILPDATILIIQYSIFDAMFPWNSIWHRKRLQKAIDIIIGDPAAVETATTRSRYEQTMLVHAFSNGGMITSWLLLPHLAKDNIRVCSGLILDSCPGEGAYLKTVSGFIVASGADKMSPLPRMFLQAAAYVGVWIGRSVIPWVMGTSNAIVLAARGLNNPDILETNIPRLYIYSRSDELVPQEEVVSHVKDAKERGYLYVQECLFEETGHCAHLRGDPEKYWSSVLKLSDLAWGGDKG